MTHYLARQNSRPFGETYDGENVYMLAPSSYEETEHSCVPPTIATPQGINTQFSITHTPGDKYRCTGLYLQWTATNSSGTEAPTFLHAYLTLQKAILKINNVEVQNLADRQAIMAQVSDYLKNFSQDELYVRMQKFRAETGTTLAGETCAVSTTKTFSLDLFVLFPWLENYIPMHVIKKLELEVFFAENNASVVNGLYVVSNTANNAYGSNLTYSNIRVKICKAWHTDPMLYKHVNPVQILVPKWETKAYYAQSWTGSETLTVDLNSIFSVRNRILGMSVFIISPAMITAYNDADASLYYSGPTYIGYKILSRSKPLVELNGTAKLPERRRYLIDTHKRRYDQWMPNEVISESTNLGKLYYLATYIDFSNVAVSKCDDYGVAGISNAQKDIEVVLYSESNINASCNVYCVLHYLEAVQPVDKDLNIRLVK